MSVGLITFSVMSDGLMAFFKECLMVCWLFSGVVDGLMTFCKVCLMD